MSKWCMKWDGEWVTRGNFTNFRYFQHPILQLAHSIVLREPHLQLFNDQFSCIQCILTQIFWPFSFVGLFVTLLSSSFHSSWSWSSFSITFGMPHGGSAGDWCTLGLTSFEASISVTFLVILKASTANERWWVNRRKVLYWPSTLAEFNTRTTCISKSFFKSNWYK